MTTTPETRVVQDAATVCKTLAPYLGATAANDWTGMRDDDAVSMSVKLRVGDLRALKDVAAAPAAPASGHASNGSATAGKDFPDGGNNVPIFGNECGRNENVAAPAPEPVAFQTLTAGKWVECSEFVAKGWGDTLADGCRALYAAPPTPVAASAVDAIQFIEKRRDDYVRDHGIYDPSTGVTEFPGNGDEYVGELEEIIDGLRAAAEGNR